MVILSGKESACFCYRLIIYVLPLGVQPSREGGCDYINLFNFATFYAHFQRHVSWSFCGQWVQFSRGVIVRFVDIGGIDYYHCLNFLFIIIFNSRIISIYWTEVNTIILWYCKFTFRDPSTELWCFYLFEILNKTRQLSMTQINIPFTQYQSQIRTVIWMHHSIYYSDVQPPIVNYPIFRNSYVGYEERPECIPCNSNYLLKPILIDCVDVTDDR